MHVFWLWLINLIDWVWTKPKVLRGRRDIFMLEVCGKYPRIIAVETNFGLNVQRMCVTCCAQLDLISRCPKMSRDGRQLFSQMFQTYHLALNRFWGSSRVSMKDNWWQLTLLLSSCCAKIVGKNAAGVWRETVSANFSLLSHGHCHVICLFTKFIFREYAFSIGVREIVFLSSLYATDRL